MTNEVVVALIASVPVTLTAIGGIWLGFLNLHQGRANHTQGEEIHLIVNSNYDKVKAELKAAEEKIAQLEIIIIKLQEHCALLKV